MSAFFYGILTQWKLDFRNKGILLVYYVVPILFFAFMGGIFTSINPSAAHTLTQTMVVFAISMGAFLGTPVPLVELYSSEIKKTYVVSNIPLWTIAVNSFVSAFIHLWIVSIIISISSPLIFGATPPTHLGAYLIGINWLIIASLSIGTVLGLLVNKTSILTMIAQLFFLPSIMLSGIMFPSSMLPELLMKIGRAFPATWGFEIMQSIALEYSMFYPALITVAICLIIGIIKINRIKID